MCMRYDLRGPHVWHTPRLNRKQVAMKSDHVVPWSGSNVCNALIGHTNVPTQEQQRMILYVVCLDNHHQALTLFGCSLVGCATPAQIRGVCANHGARNAGVRHVF